MLFLLFLFILFWSFASGLDGFQAGLGTNGVVAEVPQFPLINFHGKMWANHDNIWQYVTTCDKQYNMWQHVRT